MVSIWLFHRQICFPFDVSSPFCLGFVVGQSFYFTVSFISISRGEAEVKQKFKKWAQGEEIRKRPSQTISSFFLCCMLQLCIPPLNKYERVHLFFVSPLRVYTLCVDVCAHSGIIFSSFFFFFWMASNEKPIRAHTKGEPWRLKERRAAGETGPSFALSICNTFKHAAREKERKKEKKNVHFSLSLWIYYLYGYVLCTTTYRREKYFALTFLVCSLVFSHMVIFHTSLRPFFFFFFGVSSFSFHFIFCPFAVYSYKSWLPRVSYSPSFGGAIESLLSLLYRFRSFSYFYLVRIFWLIELNARLLGSMDPILSLLRRPKRGEKKNLKDSLGEKTPKLLWLSEIHL